MIKRINNIPSFLKEIGLFCLVRNGIDQRTGKQDKAPYECSIDQYKKAYLNKPETFSTFDDAINTLQSANTIYGEKYRSIGILAYNGICFIDFDHCVNKDGVIDSEIDQWIDYFDSYAEYSISGEGIHIYFTCKNFINKFTHESYKEIYKERSDNIECYLSAPLSTHYAVITGNQIKGTPNQIKDVSDKIEVFLKRYLLREQPKSERNRFYNANAQSYNSELTVDKVIELLKKDPSFIGLVFDGKKDGLDKYPSLSEADQALADKTAFYAQGDAILIEQVMRKSAICRDGSYTKLDKPDKWNRHRSYLKETIDKAIKSCKGNFYDPNHYKKADNPVNNNIEETLLALEITDEGTIKSTIDNFYLILTLDPQLKGKYCFDIFANKRMVIEPLEWENPKDQLPRQWRDSDEANLRHYIEKNYRIKNKSALEDAISMAFNEAMVHPVQEYLESLKWDGTKRVETLLIDYFGAEDNVYTREIILKALLGAVARVYQPGIKFDTVLILKGEQGTGKSTFVRLLSSDEWFSDSLTKFDGKDAYELLSGKWIIELGELKGLGTKDIEQAKQFFSKTSDQYRAAYARNPIDYPRQCIFIGTTNNDTFLSDRTGNRRFWPVELGINESSKSVWDDLENERDQIWAEVKSRYDQLISENNLPKSLILTPEAEQIANFERDNRLEFDSRIDEIIEFIKRKIPVDWKNYSLESRCFYWDNPESYEGETIQRDMICLMEIAQELYRIPEFEKQKFIREISQLMPSIKGLKRFIIPRQFGKAFKSKQKGYEILNEFWTTYK